MVQNMDEMEFEDRCAKEGHPMINFQNLQTASLEGYKLVFNYYSRKNREAGVANIMEDMDSRVYGLLSEIDDGELETIRKKGGYPNYYNELYVKVELLSGEKSMPLVKTYKASKLKEQSDYRPPTQKYTNLTINCAKKFAFPQEYIEYLPSLPTK